MVTTVFLCLTFVSARLFRCRRFFVRALACGLDVSALVRPDPRPLRVWRVRGPGPTARLGLGVSVGQVFVLAVIATLVLFVSFVLLFCLTSIDSFFFLRNLHIFIKKKVRVQYNVHTKAHTAGKESPAQQQS